jgi:HEPN domain-containing protein
MSQEKNWLEARRWFDTAEDDLKGAELLATGGMYALACFHAQQSAKKAVKALWHLVDADPWGHSVLKLLNEFPRRADLPDAEALLVSARTLDQFYIPTRYPNSLPDVTPSQAYGAEDARRGMTAARHILETCRDWLRKDT